MTTGEGIQLFVAIVLTATLVAVSWYAYEARRQATATRRIAESSLRPIIEQWIDRTPVTDSMIIIWYRNIGQGPALNIEWRLEPSGQRHGRVSMATATVEEKGRVEFTLDGRRPLVIVSKYSDAGNKRWVSRLELTERGGMLDNGLASHLPD